MNDIMTGCESIHFTPPLCYWCGASALLPPPLVLSEKLVEPKDGLCRPRLLPMHPPTKGSRSNIVNHFSSKEENKSASTKQMTIKGREIYDLLSYQVGHQKRARAYLTDKVFKASLGRTRYQKAEEKKQTKTYPTPQGTLVTVWNICSLHGVGPMLKFSSSSANAS